jgi:hypothetical protein
MWKGGSSERMWKEGSGEGALGVCVRAGEGSVHTSGRIDSW